MVALSVNMAGVKLKNPVVPASGTFGFGREFSELYDLNVLGAISVKGITREPRIGNPLPRIAETPSGMLNAVGLENRGIDAVLREELPWLRAHFDGPIIANVGGFSPEEYASNCERLAASDAVSILEVNISCPNVHCGGRNFGSSPESAAAITKAVRGVTDKPIFMKLSPNVADIAEVARACEGEGADGLCLINTLVGMRIDIARRKPVLANVTGGLSGPAILPVALRMVWAAYEAVKIPIIGCGGVASAEDAIEMMMAGATAVEVGAANLIDPMASRRIAESLPSLCARLGIADIAGIVGAAHDFQRTK